MSDEVRVKNALTGGEKGSKLARYDLLPVGPLKAVAEHYGKGAEKYEDRNWERGYDWSLSYAAMQRHANAFWNGEDIDHETGSPHLAAVVFHALALMEWAKTHPEMDNRPGVERAKRTQAKVEADADLAHAEYLDRLDASTAKPAERGPYVYAKAPDSSWLYRYAFDPTQSGVIQ